jgi:phosphatidylglycerophosphatase A
MLGIGRVPFASGTVATLATVPLYLLAHALGGPLLVLGLALLALAAGTACATVVERRLGYHDPSEVVVDEVAGFLVTMTFIAPTAATCIAGFLLFRALDVVKPWPASAAERWPGGWGIMADDLLCGIIANLILHAGLWLWR